METILANCSVSISELKCTPDILIEQAEGEPIAIINNNKPTAYLIPAETYAALIERLDDYLLGQIVKERQNEKKAAIEISINEL
ncbi:Antitoxin [Candidatus Magnetomoraceae bacterium gMMP-15]